MMFIEGGGAVTCTVCKDSIAGCAGGPHCPLLATTVVNAAGLIAGASSTIVLKSMVPNNLMMVFSRQVIDQLCFLMKQQGRLAPFDPVGKSFVAIYSAFTNGLLGKAEATSALLFILGDDTLTEGMRSSVAATLNSLAAATVATVAAAGVASTQLVGPYRFIVAAILKFLTTKINTISIGASSSTASSSRSTFDIVLSAPRTAEVFYEMLTLFTMFCHALGASDVLLTTAFIAQVVYEKIRRHNYTWMMAYCLFIVYLKAVDESEDSSKTISNIHSDGGLDSHADEAVALGQSEYGKTFRKTRLAAAQPDGDEHDEDTGARITKVWNGRDTAAAPKACISHNRNTGHPAKALKQDGTCKYKHVCFHWISGSGTAAICGSRKHVYADCDHVDKCDASAP